MSPLLQGSYTTLQASAGLDAGGGPEAGIMPGTFDSGKLKLTWGANAGVVGLQGEFGGDSNPSVSNEPKFVESLKEKARLDAELGGTINAEVTWTHPYK